MSRPIQPELPLMCREVSWYVGEYSKNSSFRERVFRALGNRATPRYDLLIESSGRIVTRKIDAGWISRDHIADSDLRYALRFADAANAMGWMYIDEDGSGKYAHDVVVTATDEGSDSKLLSAVYSGKPGDFEESLRSFIPE